jgi:uncharacterized linocin/CFP29 family protein
MDPIQSLGGLLGANQSMQARLLAGNFSVNCLRTNATLRRDEWIFFDNVVLEVARSRMVISQLLASRGQTIDLPNPLGHTRFEWEKVGDMEGAEITMSGISRSQNDGLDFSLEGMPIPIVHKDFNLNIRHLAASRNRGTPIDTMQLTVSTRKVAETIERMIFNGATVLGANNTIYGLTTAPHRNTGSVTANWATAATGSQIVADVLEMIGVSQGDNFYGPFVLFVPIAAHTAMGADYKAESDRTILDRVMAIPGIEAVIPTNDLSGTNIILVQLTSDVISVIDGFGPTLVEWESHGGMVSHYKVMAIQVPLIRNDVLNQSGIVHYS